MRTVGFELILEALDVSLDSCKIVFAIGGLFVVGGVTGLLSFIGQEVDSDPVATALLVLAALAAWILSNLVYGTVAKMSYDDLGRRPNHGWLPALGYAARHLPALLFSPLALLIAIALVLVVEGLVLMVGHVPYLGELWVSLLFLPLVVLNLFLILLGYLGVWLVPAVVAGEGGGIWATLRCVQQAVRRAPGRILAYLSIAVVLGVLAALIVIPLVYAATAGTIAFATAVMVGPDVIDLASTLSGLELDSISYVLGNVFQLGSGRDRVTLQIAGVILGLALLLIPMAILAVLLVVFPVSCACASYLSVRQDEPEPAPVPVTWVEPRQQWCANCGAEVSPQARFCLRCGHPQGPR
jgi:hypothetical protein